MLPGPAAFRTFLAWVTSGPNKHPRLWTRKTRFYGTSIPQSHSGPILTFWNRTGWLTQGLYWAQSSSLHTILYWTAHRSIPHQSGAQNNSPSSGSRRNPTSPFTWPFSCQPTYHLNQTRRMTQHNLNSWLTACDPFARTLLLVIPLWPLMFITPLLRPPSRQSLYLVSL